MSLHYDDMIGPIYSEFTSLLLKYNSEIDNEDRAMQVAFFVSLKNNIEVLQSEIAITEECIRNDKGYIKHLEEKRGHEIGKAINERPDLHNTSIRDMVYCTMIRKQVFVVKLKEDNY